jgi:hypothetical protein
MTTAGTLLIGSSIYLMNTAAPVPETLKAEALVPVVETVEEPIVLVEEAVVWSAPPAEPKAIPPVVVTDPVKEVEELAPEPAILPEPPTTPTPPVQVASGPSAPTVKSGGVFVGGGRREFGSELKNPRILPVHSPSASSMVGSLGWEAPLW